MTYASLSDVAEYRQVDLAELGDEAAWAPRLAAADLEVQRLTMTAVYAVDEGGVPTDPDAVRAFARAAAAQASWFEETGDLTGAAELIGPARAGDVVLPARAAASGTGSPRTAPDAVTILRLAGLTRGFIAPW